MKMIVPALAACLLLSGCKKEDKKSSGSESTPVPAEVKKQVSVKINGTEFSCSTCANTYKSSGFNGINVRETNTDRFVLMYSGFMAPGTYPISPTDNLSLIYEKNGGRYSGKGSLTLTATDTSASGTVKKFIATFSCATDTASDGTSFRFTDGSLNINF